MSKTERIMKSSLSSSVSSFKLSTSKISISHSDLRKSSSIVALNQKSQYEHQQQQDESSFRNHYRKNQHHMTNLTVRKEMKVSNLKMEETTAKREMKDEASKDELVNQLEEYKTLVKKSACLLNLKWNFEMSEIFFRVFHEKLEHEINSHLECKKKMKKSEESLIEMTLQNQTLIEENTNISKILSTLSDETLTLMDSLNLCIQDMDDLSSIWIDFSHEKDKKLDTSLGFSKDVSCKSFNLYENVLINNKSKENLLINIY
jgi:hypothetical protein